MNSVAGSTSLNDHAQLRMEINGDTYFHCKKEGKYVLLYATAFYLPVTCTRLAAFVVPEVPTFHLFTLLPQAPSSPLLYPHFGTGEAALSSSLVISRYVPKVTSFDPTIVLSSRHGPRRRRGGGNARTPISSYPRAAPDLHFPLHPLRANTS